MENTPSNINPQSLSIAFTTQALRIVAPTAVADMFGGASLSAHIYVDEHIYADEPGRYVVRLERSLTSRNRFGVEKNGEKVLVIGRSAVECVPGVSFGATRAETVERFDGTQLIVSMPRNCNPVKILNRTWTPRAAKEAAGSDVDAFRAAIRVVNTFLAAH